MNAEQFLVLTDGIVRGRTVLSMPEVFIGFFPDVGATRFLGGLRPGLGKYLGITGARLKGITDSVMRISTLEASSHLCDHSSRW